MTDKHPTAEELYDELAQGEHSSLVAAKALAALRAAERDARRYRWLRHEMRGELLDAFEQAKTFPAICDASDVGLDVAIDNALAREQEEGK